MCSTPRVVHNGSYVLVHLFYTTSLFDLLYTTSLLSLPLVLIYPYATIHGVEVSLLHVCGSWTRLRLLLVRVPGSLWMPHHPRRLEISKRNLRYWYACLLLILRTRKGFRKGGNLFKFVDSILNMMVHTWKESMVSCHVHDARMRSGAKNLPRNLRMFPL